VVVVLFIWAYFREWKMSVAAIVALAHDVLITVGIYALSGFEVSPATVTGILTILGFSLYDTVVVFDKVRENTKNLRRHTTYAAGGEPRRQPDAGPLDQHLDRRAAPGRRDPVRRRGPARLGLAQGPRAGAVRRHGRRCLLVDLHRDAAAGAAQAQRDRHRREGAAARAAAGTPSKAADRYSAVPTFSEKMPMYDEKSGRPEGRR
jgi:preprotein translocase subunit SecF